MAKSSKHKTINIRTVFISFVIGAGYWFIEGLAHYLIFRRQPFVKSLFPTEPHELWMRSFIACLLMICWLYVKHLMNKQQESGAVNRKSIIINRKTVLTAVGFALLYWFFEGTMHNIIFPGESWLKHLFPVDSHELWMRSFVFCLIVVFSLVIHGAIARLHESRNFLQTVVDGIAESVTVIDSDYNIILTNHKIKDSGFKW